VLCGLTAHAVAAVTPAYGDLAVRPKFSGLKEAVGSPCDVFVSAEAAT
jgi:hypothetical protein